MSYSKILNSFIVILLIASIFTSGCTKKDKTNEQIPEDAINDYQQSTNISNTSKDTGSNESQDLVYMDTINLNLTNQTINETDIQEGNGTSVQPFD
ncbi:MAG: hypothetical protein ABIJ10_00685, partial [Candidatus Micrarchaeota archaeon]